jgi:hypothetical protein
VSINHEALPPQRIYGEECAGAMKQRSRDRKRLKQCGGARRVEGDACHLVSTQLIEAGVDVIMSSHPLYPKLDPAPGALARAPAANP